MSAFLAARSIAFLVLIPGTVTLYIPWQILTGTGVRRPEPSFSSALAAAVLVFGAGVLLKCVWDFFAAGRGTLAPFDPPRQLVVRGLYRFTRNPMYNGVLAMLLGEAWLFRSTSMLQYAALMFVIFHVAVVVYEEPTLESDFGDSYREYRRAVPRWGFTTRPFDTPAVPA